MNIQILLKLLHTLEQLRQHDGAEVPHLTAQTVPAIPNTASGKAQLIKAYRPARIE